MESTDILQLNKVLGSPKAAADKPAAKKRDAKKEAKQKEASVTESEYDSYLSGEEEVSNHNKRGRKKVSDKQYFDDAKKKIKEIKDTLKTAKQDGKDAKERQRLRNQISAQQSRIKKKEETIQLQAELKESHERFNELMAILDYHLADNHDLLAKIKSDIEERRNRKD